MDVGHLLKIDPASTGATARRLSRGKSPLKGRGARGGAGAVEPGLTLHLIPLRGSSKAAGLWYRNRRSMERKKGEDLEEYVENKERIYIGIVQTGWTRRTRITDSQCNTGESNLRMMKKHETAS
ncbi:hypothetical protein T4E_10826 [Trichinella pseudospiralis]|uniref:Uncharacterized protein n=2 Tax=Trichinella pseudospiralis TaxID=6337 RepID=A0A0V0Y7R6_TRIPS|nr:hypothetical protein T4E_10826 [Trichinella pseudospiralis]